MCFCLLSQLLQHCYTLSPACYWCTPFKSLDIKFRGMIHLISALLIIICKTNKPWIQQNSSIMSTEPAVKYGTYLTSGFACHSTSFIQGRKSKKKKTMYHSRHKGELWQTVKKPADKFTTFSTTAASHLPDIHLLSETFQWSRFTKEKWQKKG